MKLNWNVDASWTLFIDRDGVINERNFEGYVLNKQDFIFKEGVLEIARSLFSKFKYVVLVTNQQCIGKGLISSDGVREIHNYMESSLIQNGAKIDLILVAPEVRGAKNSTRKPQPHMGILAQNKMKSIDFSKSIMVGDTDSDIEFGKNLDMKTVLIESSEKCTSIPDVKMGSLMELNKWLQ
ncbi:HAD-IIIA family hydrolase [Crocinitomicaceae bacterium]|nr:HAD-IIIA family hydrolase [Crocinitomicaceae bacterium]